MTRAHHASHLALLRPVVAAQPWGRAAVDAVLVPVGPGSRPRSSALDAAGLLRCPLLAVCHPRVDLDRVHDEGRSAGVRVYAVPAEPPRAVPLPAATALAVPPSEKQRNIAVARNVGLLVARLAGWRRVLFLDDDMADIDVAAVRDAGRRLHDAGFAAVGWTAGWYPDNSVVCHANRLAGHRQGTFVGTGTLLTSVTPATPHFAAVYDDDWLFLFDALRRQRVGFAGRVLQLSYAPFAAPARARDEEFGDLLAEGLFHLLHEVREGWLPESRLDDTMHSKAFWESEIEFRDHFVAGIADRLATRLDAGDLPPGQERDVPAALASLDAARTRLAGLAPSTLVDFVDAWREDGAAWSARLATLHPLGSVLSAFDRLGITDHRPWTD